jgi:hypothetical protein
MIVMISIAAKMYLFLLVLVQGRRVKVRDATRLAKTHSSDSRLNPSIYLP